MQAHGDGGRWWEPYTQGGCSPFSSRLSSRLEPNSKPPNAHVSEGHGRPLKAIESHGRRQICGDGGT